MEKRISNYLKYSFVAAAAICIGLFIYMGHHMNNATGEMVDDVSNMYLDELTSQLQQKFRTIIALKAEQLEGLIERTPPEESKCGDEMCEQMSISASVRDFASLGMYRYDGTIEMIYGDELVIAEEMEINCNCENRNHMIHLGYDNDGNKMLILGRVVQYTMSDGQKSDVLFATLPFEYLNKAMYLSVDNTQITSHIIDEEGNYIIKNGSAEKYTNAFEKIEAEVIPVNRKIKKDYIEEFKAALISDEDYSCVYMIGERTKRMYMAKLAPGLDWYIMTVIPDGEIGDIMNNMYTTRYSMLFAIVFIIIIVMIAVFVGYYDLSKEQMRELAKARQEADRANDAKSRFLTSMSHDIRTPMNAIIGMSDIAMKNIEDTKKATDCLKKVQLSSRHLLGLINDVLDMSKIESGKLTMENGVVSLRQLAGECVDIMQPQIKAKEQYFDIFIRDIICENIFSDSVRLSQVLLNLLSNATKYTPVSGNIYLHIYQQQSDKGSDYVKTVFVVQDNGIGMSEEFRKKIFELFAREDTETVRNINGSGLGMAITKSIVDMMEGTIDIDSKPGEGTTFTVSIDAKMSEVDEGRMSLPTWRVLVVDDNEQLCTSASETLKEIGLLPDWTQDGMEAIRMVEKRHMENDDYHFVLMDWKMPNMDGVETIREMRKRLDVDIPIFMISAYSKADVENVLENIEIAGFISKPLFKSNLYETLSEYINHEKLTVDEPENEVELSAGTLLLAEDNDINAEIVEELFAMYGIKIDRAINGKECVEMFETNGVDYYDAVLMDVHMPIMDGYQATHTIRSMNRQDCNIPIIAMTADVFSDNMERCLESGMNECITKPIDIKECIRVLKKYI